MTNLIPVILASTFGAHQPIESRRTQIMFSKEAVEEFVKQVLQRQYDSNPVNVFLHPPLKKETLPKNDIIIPGMKAKNTSDMENPVIGKIISAELIENRDYGVWQCKATINFLDGIASKIQQHKHEMCVISQFDQDPERSLKQINQVMVNEDSKALPTYLLSPPLTLLFCHMGMKRNSTNPYLCIL